MKRQKFDNEILIFSVKSPSVFIVKSGPIADKTESSKGMISINLVWYCLYIFEHTTAASAPPTRLEITSGATTNRKSGNKRPMVEYKLYNISPPTWPSTCPKRTAGKKTSEIYMDNKILIISILVRCLIYLSFPIFLAKCQLINRLNLLFRMRLIYLCLLALRASIFSRGRCSKTTFVIAWCNLSPRFLSVVLMLLSQVTLHSK